MTTHNQTLWLHIGSPRTGTTALQNFLYKNKSDLSRIGLFYIDGGNAQNKSMNRLFVASKNGNEVRVKRLRDRISREIEASKSRDFVISAEHMFHWRPEAVLDVLNVPQSVEIRVVVYLRRQDLFLESIYRQLMKSRPFLPSFEKYSQARLGTPNYRELIQSWEQLGVTVVPRIYERETIGNKSIVADFFDLIEFKPDLELPIYGKTRSNESLHYKALQIQQILLRFGRQPLSEDALQNLSRCYENSVRGSVIPDELAATIVGACERDNEWVREAYFGNRPSLFDMQDLTTPSNRQLEAKFSRADLQAILRLSDTTQKIIC